MLSAVRIMEKFHAVLKNSIRKTIFKNKLKVPCFNVNPSCSASPKVYFKIISAKSSSTLASSTSKGVKSFFKGIFKNSMTLDINQKFEK